MNDIAQQKSYPKLGDDLMQFFAWEHLPAHLQGISRPFGQLAASMVAQVQPCAERTVMLRKLLEAKDCAVRAALWRPAS